MDLKAKYSRHSFCKMTIAAAGSLCCAGVFGCSFPLAGRIESSAGAATLSVPDAAPTDEDASINRRLREKTAEYEEQIGPYRRDVELGETISLANIDADITVTNPGTGEQIQRKMPDFVSWDGTLDVSIDFAALYDSIDEAMQAQHVGELTESRSAVGDDEQIVVIQAGVTNVDAVSWSEGGYFNVNFLAPMYVAVGADGLDAINAVIVAFDGAPAEALVNEKLKSKFLLEQGQTKVLTTAWRLVVEGRPSTLCIRPSMTSSEPGPIKFLLGLGNSDDAAA